ncbi:DEAD/DEAH box helicase family protein [Treponema socranskii]|uniref:DEAD/DEAH box helicase family protein n=1 Tax=Treponema socranskii TaxID=53419 RepID=UPI0028722822|nr:DEAD/DEAH box helicase family protein [Treponema socranskii]MDR9859448.1 DEAD/DEAH box helicase family protein [Treponema socranskii]
MEMMLCNKIQMQKEILDESDYTIPSYITDNLKYPLYDWQRTALENFLINEKFRSKLIKKDEILSPNHLMFNMATGSGKTLVMAALILYYYKQGYRNFIFFVNQNAILGKTQANFIDTKHTKYLFKENVVIDCRRVVFREVDMFSDFCDDIQIKFTTIQKLHNDIYKESENSVLLSDLQKRDIILFGDEAHHLNASTAKKKQMTLSDDISFIGELKDSAKEEDIERSWEHTVCHCILNKDGKNQNKNNNALLEFTATVPNTPEVLQKYEDKIIIKFELKDFVEAGCTKHIRLVRSNLILKERILQALLLNWYRYRIALKAGIPNFKPVILFRSKTIEDSKTDCEKFIALRKSVTASDFNFIHNLSKITMPADDAIPSPYTVNRNLFERILTYMKDNDFSFENVADYIRENFQERTIIITNSKTNKTKKEKTDSEIDRLLNSLEDYDNHIRAIFTVQRLTEGWDVLNLYDIVRLYRGRDTDTKKHKAGTSTTSEVQLIGRGVRYYPFAYNDMPVNRRKFDDDIRNELRILEEFYFHSDEDHRYINELSNELKNKGLITEKRTQKIFPVKPAQQQRLNGMYLFVNDRIENSERRLKKLPDDFQNLPPFEYRITTNPYSEIRDVDFQKDDAYLAVASGPFNTKSLNFSDIPIHIKYKAVHRLNANAASYYNFENILRRFNVQSMEEFFDFIKDVKIMLTHDTDKYENIPNKKMLEMCEKFFTYLQSELEKFDKPYKGTDFRLVKFSDMFSFDQQKGKICFTKEKLISIDEQASETQENKTLEKELQTADWYALDAFWGTSEERNLIQFIKDRKSNLLANYDSFQLLRNEEVYKIFDFDTGRGFQPDFLLFLHGKVGNPNAYYQVFIEPKGKFLAGDDNDGWKQDFLEEIAKRYGKEHAVIERNSSYVLIGLPFFNSNDEKLKSKFLKAFEKTILADY